MRGLARTKIFLGNENGGADNQHSAAEFLSWILSNYRVQIFVDGYERDLSEAALEDGVAAIYPGYALDEPLPWQHALIGVGMFRELSHDGRAARSLLRVRREDPGSDEERLVAYLSSGLLYRRAVEDTEDYFDDDVRLDPPHLLTDGTFVGRTDLAYYLRKYHVELPRAFVIHARQNDWRIPREVDVAALPDQIC